MWSRCARFCTRTAKLALAPRCLLTAAFIRQPERGDTTMTMPRLTPKEEVILRKIQAEMTLPRLSPREEVILRKIQAEIDAKRAAQDAKPLRVKDLRMVVRQLRTVLDARLATLKNAR